MAALRWEWLVENGGEDLGEHEEFVRHFVDWARGNAGCIGAWWSCVTTTASSSAWPGWRWSSGCPRRGRRGGPPATSGLERVTVHSSRRAIPAYARCGFQESPRLLQARVAGA
ncbi:GNAT family N-acetyltransferase [Streptomyces coeruleorubidus]|uniref:GNAT family N-acetyltransferase n=1 Tax=Streptomyces coeruleorubidus TaxID=116188 RepID=UPI0019C03BDD|nr:GNAT family N-acetyltransferase [Streptomyces coeruleorubidus]GGT51367.1 N-acetyltransferase [Streptomyces coeruleorubidus]